MEWIARLVAYVGSPWQDAARERQRLAELEAEAEARRKRQQHQLQLEEEADEARALRDCQCSAREALHRLLAVLESLLLWESTLNSLSLLVAFNLLFWGFVVLEVRGFVAASSAALVIVLCYSTLEIQVEGATNSQMSQTKSEQVERFVKKAKSTFESLMHLQQEHPRAFCTGLFTALLGLWLIGHNLDSVLLTYAICMSILVGPAILLRSSSKELSNKEWDSEIEEFLPAVTEDNLQVLTRAGDTGDRSLTPPSPDIDTPSDNFDEDLIGLKMPSHEDGSTDGLELSELELSAGETDIDGVRFQSSHFERDSSSSDDDVELGLESSKLDEGDSDNSEFEIIDTREVASLKNV